LSERSFDEKIILSVDVEDNFTRDELAVQEDWKKYETQVVENTGRVIRLLHRLNADATFFVVGKTAERHPELAEMIVEGGFEAASHGYAHEPVDQMTEEEFEVDLRKSVSILEGITSTKIKGYRARSFSINRNTLWAFEVLRRNGLAYDSSLTESEFKYLSGNEPGFNELLNGLVEIPVCNKRFVGRNWAISGGAVLRLLFFPFYRFLLENCCDENRCKIIYAHVWEFNRDQPKRKVGWLQKMGQSSFTYSTPLKIEKISATYKFISMDAYLEMA
jgi:polysaccharide deacetylase family protein (PEP-CTERM system associated)